MGGSCSRSKQAVGRFSGSKGRNVVGAFTSGGVAFKGWISTPFEVRALSNSKLFRKIIEAISGTQLQSGHGCSGEFWLRQKARTAGESWKCKFGFTPISSARYSILFSDFGTFPMSKEVVWPVPVKFTDELNDLDGMSYDIQAGIAMFMLLGETHCARHELIAVETNPPNKRRLNHG